MNQDARHDEEQSAQRRARILGMAYVDTSQMPQKPLYKELLTFSELSSMRVVPLQADNANIIFGVTNTTSQQTMNSLRQRFQDQRIAYALISDAGFREYMKLYNPPKEVIYEDIELTTAGSDSLVERVSAVIEQIRADDILGYLTQQAHKLTASDIHIENQRDYVRVRFRIDGVLHPVAKMQHEKNRILLSAIASAANISTAAEGPQQGHIARRVQLADGSMVDVNLRVETVPAINGIDIVMRLFNLDQEMYVLDRLGLSVREREVVDNIISKPSGLVLAVGPTGSGKTTTLYSILNSLNSEQRKIITIEDPVEYQFEGMTQISITSKTNAESNFANKFRAVLRLDPDIIMVGEIRDSDTAKTALQAALTGHLVLSTFHASSASAALTRLLDVIGENPLFVSAIRLIMAQRLVRRLDDETKQPYVPDTHTLAGIKRIVDSMPPNIERPNLDGLKLYKPGTSAKNPYGYRGQIALREQFLMESMVQDLISEKGLRLSTQEIEKTAVNNGMNTMLHDGILKAIQGQTTLEELYRVIG